MAKPAGSSCSIWSPTSNLHYGFDRVQSPIKQTCKCSETVLSTVGTSEDWFWGCCSDSGQHRKAWLGSVPARSCSRLCLEASLMGGMGAVQFSPSFRTLPTCNLGLEGAVTQLKTNRRHIFTCRCQLSWINHSYPISKPESRWKTRTSETFENLFLSLSLLNSPNLKPKEGNTS